MRVRLSSARRLVKRAARHLWVRGHALVGGRRGGVPSPGLRILTYHRVAEDPADPFCVRPRSFRAQMETLAGLGIVRGLDDSLDEIKAPGRSGPRIAITVDDGTEDFARDVLPVLVRLRLPATLYVSPARVGSPGFLDWRQLRESVAAGIAIGSHGLDHRSLGRMPLAEAARQLADSKRLLEDALGIPVVSLAYPYGTWKDFNAAVMESAVRAGYESACTSLNGVNRHGAEILGLRRTKIEQGDDPLFASILSGCIDSWYVVDRYLWVLQNRYA